MNQALAPETPAPRSAILLPNDYYNSLLRDLPERNTEMEGGRFVGIFQCNDHVYGLVVASIADGEFKGKWGKTSKEIAAFHVADGLANTIAMAEAGSEIATRSLELVIGGQTGWHIGARDNHEMAYRHGKPTADKNWSYYRSGDNPSSLPPGLPYRPDFPLQTTMDGFKPGEPYAFESAPYWSSTQCSAHDAFCQYFAGGNQSFRDKDDTLRVRAVRRFLIH